MCTHTTEIFAVRPKKNESSLHRWMTASNPQPVGPVSASKWCRRQNIEEDPCG